MSRRHLLDTNAVSDFIYRRRGVYESKLRAYFARILTSVG